MENLEDKTLEEMQAKFLEAQTNLLAQGGTVADTLEIDPETLEPLYTLAYNHYVSGNYDDANVLFQALCLYNHSDVRFWMGLAGTRQALGDYKVAIEAYSMAGLVTLMADPTPFIYASICHMKLGDMESAKGGLEGALLLGKGDAQYDAIIKKGEVLLEAVNANLLGQESSQSEA